MPIVVNIRHLETSDVQLTGQLDIAELDIDNRDELIQLRQPLEYELEAQKLDEALLVQGRLHLVLDCQCVRCLKPLQHHIQLTHWVCHLPLQGEDKVSVINDCVDLTPYVREDILLEFPQHPLCESGCRGVYPMHGGKVKTTSDSGNVKSKLSAWAELDKLKFGK